MADKCKLEGYFEEQGSSFRSWETLHEWDKAEIDLISERAGKTLPRTYPCEEVETTTPAAEADISDTSTSRDRPRDTREKIAERTRREREIRFSSCDGALFNIKWARWQGAHFRRNVWF